VFRLSPSNGANAETAPLKTDLYLILVVAKIKLLFGATSLLCLLFAGV
jgi:hypothetical protein